MNAAKTCITIFVVASILRLAALDDRGRLGDASCCFCDALLFPGEAVRLPGKIRRTRGRSCCANGKVELVPTREVPEITELVHGTGLDSNTLRRFPRKFNNALALASECTHVDTMGGGWAPTFTIQGALHHRIGPVRVATDADQAVGARNFLQVRKSRLLAR